MTTVHYLMWLIGYILGASLATGTRFNAKTKLIVFIIYLILCTLLFYIRDIIKLTLYDNFMGN